MKEHTVTGTRIIKFFKSEIEDRKKSNDAIKHFKSDNKYFWNCSTYVYSFNSISRYLPFDISLQEKLELHDKFILYAKQQD